MAIFALIFEFFKVAPEEAWICSNDDMTGCGGDGARPFGHASQDGRGLGKHFEVRVVNLDKFRLREAMRAPGIGIAEKEKSEDVPHIPFVYL